MILPFSTKLNGKETFFVEKILQNFLKESEIKGNKTHDWVADAIYEAGVNLKYEYADDILDKVDQCKPKLHTIREDKNNRWHKGVMIDFFINVRQKNMFRFAPKVAVVSTQEVEIYYDYDIENQTTKSTVWIDDMIFYDSKRCDKGMLKFAQNDGFDTIEDFLDYFDKNYKGKIIHWTDLRY